jgi:hypothetical protein
VVHEIHNHPMRYYPHLIHSMCWQSAMKAVKRQLQARGEKVMQFPSRDLRILADEYLAAHRDELIEDAIGMVRTVPGWLKIAEAEARRRGRLWPSGRSEIKRPRVLPIDVIEDRRLFPR